MLKVKEYTGTKMELFLEELTDEVTVLWPQQDLVGNPDDTEDEGDEDEDMADDNDEDDSDEYGDDA